MLSGKLVLKWPKSKSKLLNGTETSFRRALIWNNRRGWGQKKKEGGREGGKIVILFSSTSTQISNHKTSKHKNDISKQHSKQAIRRGSWEKLQTVC